MPLLYLPAPGARMAAAWVAAVMAAEGMAPVAGATAAVAWVAAARAAVATVPPTP